MLASLRDLKHYLGRTPTLEDAIDYFDTSLDELLKRGLWSRLLADAGIVDSIDAPDEQQLAKGLCRLSHINCPQQIIALTEYLHSASPEATAKSTALIEMLHTTLWGTQHSEFSLELAEKNCERIRQ
jgi:hypothetical protein